MKIILVGGGNKVHYLAKTFISQGHELTLINNEKEYCRDLAKRFDVNIVYGDGTKPNILEDAEVLTADLVMAVTPKDPDNLVICQLANKVYEVDKTFAIVNDPDNIEIFKKLGVDTVISTADIITSLIKQKISVEDISNIFSLEEGKVTVMEVKISSNFPVTGQKLQDIPLPRQSIIGCIIRNSESIVPSGDTAIEVGDKLLILSLPEVQSKVLQTIRGRLD
ncbi:potassium channel family protein [Natranaerobius thermophilus]|uniref:Trk system potassium uptake protein TrkA n=1 Tax=Natranaerobius thermophilus (strain ATCC BAA-1301 / DSM 18059 / JW/NM-WN-LF) TaxID=457570 RepID=B2A4T1_NATTJ|nr:NAD-binding protein [Natranaerobius thermophilus]ACB83853.1 TrkA-N domain protein [Natranaerobius thermophilus JW/NM-WN-LF]